MKWLSLKDKRRVGLCCRNPDIQSQQQLLISLTLRQNKAFLDNRAYRKLLHWLQSCENLRGCLKGRKGDVWSKPL